MPSFYPRHSANRQLPLTPPEFVPSYQTGCGGMPYQQNAFSAQPAIRPQDDGYDYAERYQQLAMAMPPMYPQAGTYLSNPPPTLPPASSFYESVAQTILPPMRMQHGHAMGGAAMQQQQRMHDFSTRPAQQPKEEKPVGGVSAKLDYDMDVMTDFVVEMAMQVIVPGRTIPPQSFRKWVHQVLCATRLPSATILLSMFYLAHRMPMLGSQPKSDSQVYRLLTISLVLGSKFLDDNTFINRSWADVSGIPVTDLNKLETEWLVAIEFKLHRDPSETQGWQSWSDHWQEYQAHAAARSNRSSKLSPIDTSMHRRSMNNGNNNINKPLPPLPMQQNFSAPPPYEFTPKSAQSPYGNPGFSQYDPWRAASEHSPSSAPTTGPTTPEYYGAHGPWTSNEGYSRRTMFFPPSQPQQHASNYNPPAYGSQYHTPPWNHHGLNCGCMYCAQRHPPYFMAPGFGPQAVAV
ncbi:hypothetical protein BU24DRAFT_122123 [Aaosphaeria arxii CBS 175.79]|uniref:Cyclin-like protein n=1 Tax=Aaosphaeria arxii CBS 175.79 TaxID=1450172 RepID=A0A6A5Y4W5_9PLEO|nr:uncharacterized protein BU24DRAFT_122123 [Aaosphaeria arxii CBS 175.79]KAF2019564.1 hypothetical protein BU24DRAFT_122123 [Aaosphaeria arxii CBS 175.79]